MFFQLRKALGAYDYGPEPDADGQPMPRTNLGRGIGCPHCVGVWAALLCAGLLLLAHPLANLMLLVLGLAGAQSWLQSRGQR